MLRKACDECPRYKMSAMNAYRYELYAMKRMFPFETTPNVSNYLSIIKCVVLYNSVY